MRDRTNLQSTIQLRPEDIDLLLAQVNDPDLLIRNVSGYDNNLTPGREYWGSAEQPFLRLSPARFEPNTTNGVRTTSADGTPLPNPRLISDVIGQQPLDAEGNTISNPNPFGTNLFLMSFGQFFDHGLDFFARGGGSFLVPIGDLEQPTCWHPGAPQRDPRQRRRQARPDRQSPRPAREQPAAFRIPDRQPRRPFRHQSRWQRRGRCQRHAGAE